MQAGLFVLTFNANVEFRIAMTPDDLKKAGLDKLGKQWARGDGQNPYGQHCVERRSPVTTSGLADDIRPSPSPKFERHPSAALDRA